MLGVPLGDSGLVFSQPDGSPSLPDTLSHAFTKIAARAGSRASASTTCVTRGPL